MSNKIKIENEALLYIVKKADVSEAENIAMLYEKNLKALHGNEISCNEWCEALLENDKDESHFIIYKGTTPVAWVKINGLCNSDNSWISMLAADPDFHRQGAGRFAVEYAEKYSKDKDKKQIFVKTTQDNLAAQKLYLKCGFVICNETEYKTGDGVSRAGIVFSKLLE